jgi:large subunit ribosomal protein L22
MRKKENSMDTRRIASAKVKYVRIAPRKVRLIIDMIRGKNVDEAETLLNFSIKRAVRPVQKLLNQLVANAKQNENVDIDNLYISKAIVDEGPTLRRYKPRAMGRATRINKRTSHIYLEAAERM